MGWNSWYYWTDRVTDKVMRDGADAMVANGMINHGYIYANIDDCWANRPGAKDANFNGPPRDAAGKVNANPRFPDMKAMTDYIHHRGLRAGIYTSPGPTTCAGCTAPTSTRSRTPSGLPSGASISSSTTGARTRTAPGLAGLQGPYRKMSAILKKQPRDIVLNLCQYGNGDVGNGARRWEGTVGARPTTWAAATSPASST